MGRISLLLSVCLMLGSVSNGNADNLVRDGSFEVGANKKLPPSWSLTGGASTVATTYGDGGGGEGNVQLQLNALPGKLGKLTQTVPVTPGSELLFTADVKSSGRVVVVIGGVRMAYHRQGQWQKLAGLIRPGIATSVTIAFELSSLGPEPARVSLNSVTLEPFQKPELLKRRNASGHTVLVEKGQPAATIIYPAKPPEYAQLARQIQATIAKQSGVTLPVVSDVDATEASAPNLKPPFASQNLIILGRLGINRALWPAYNRFLAGSDGYYPGGDGYEVRTAANVLRNGKNHIILGGSTEAGTQRAVQTFLKRLGELPPTKGTLELPWLLQAELGGDCLTAMKAQDVLWTANPLDPTLPKVEPSYGTLRRWYENAMGYYWTGWPSYQKRTQELLEPVLKDNAYPHHYVGEFFVRTVDMLDNSPLLEKQRPALDKLILSNFLDVQTQNGDQTWMTTFSPPYDIVGVANRHQISPWMMDLTLADYLHDYVELPEKAQALVDFRRSEKEGFMRSMIQERWGASLPDIPLPEGEEETALAMLRFALERGEYDLFNSGRARQLPMLDRIDARTGSWVRPSGSFDSRLIFGVLASYYQDGRYLSLRQTIPSAKPFMTRYLAGIHSYSPGSELKPQDPVDFTGVRVPPVMPHRKANLYRLQGPKFATPTFPADNVFEFGAFRSGFGPDDDFVSLTGVAGGMIPGIFTSFVSNGTNWFAGHDPYADRYFDQNAVSVVRLDQWQTQDRLYSAAAEKSWSANLKNSGGIAFSMDPFAGTKWERAVVWIRPGLYVVRDQLAAKTDVRFQISVNWFPLGAHKFQDGTWTSTSKNGQLHITPLGHGFSVPEPNAAALRQTTGVSLKSGQTVTTSTVLQSTKTGTDTALKPVQLADNALLLTAVKPEDNTLVAWEPKDIRGLSSDAKSVIVTNNSLEILNGTYLDSAGKTVFKSAIPLSLKIQWSTGRLTVDTPNKLRTIQFNGIEVPLTQDSVQLPPQKAPAYIAPLLHPSTTPLSTPNTSPESNNQLKIADETKSWKTSWRYDGLRQPMPVTGTKLIGTDIIDLGRTVNLAQIRFAPRTRVWLPRTMPTAIWTATPDAKGQMPPVESPAWKKLDQPAQWLPGVRTGNYGEAVPVEQDSQVIDPKGLKARFVRAEGVEQLQFLDAGDLGSERPLRVQSLPDGQLFVAPKLWPTFVGRPTPQDKIAVLNPLGQETFQYSSPTNLQVAEALPIGPDGKTGIALATTDAKIRLLRPDGSTQRDIDLYALQEDFNRKFGRENTRQPVGGFTMPFSLGTWRQKADAPELIVGRYGNFSFVDLATGQLNGVLRAVGYSQPAMLPSGVDFQGSGREEQVVMGRGSIRHLSGPEDRRVEQPDGILFFPQIYHDQSILEPAWEAHINGAKPILLQTVPSSNGRPRFVLVARDNYLGFYDGLTRKWGATWSPQVSIRAAAPISTGTSEVRTLTATEDGLLWDASYTDPLRQPASFKVQFIADTIAHIGTSASAPSLALLAAENGLYLYDGTPTLKTLAIGSFVHAEWADKAIVAVQKDGTILRLERTP